MATKAELQEVLDEANASRSPEEQITPEGSTKADLEAALSGAGVELPESERPAKKKGPLRVTAPLVQVYLGSTAIHLRFNDEVPEGVSDESVKHLKDLGYVTEGDAVSESDDS